MMMMFVLGDYGGGIKVRDDYFIYPVLNQLTQKVLIFQSQKCENEDDTSLASRCSWSMKFVCLNKIIL